MANIGTDRSKSAIVLSILLFLQAPFLYAMETPRNTSFSLSCVSELALASEAALNEVLDLPIELIQKNLSPEVTAECDKHEEVRENNDDEFYECCGQKFYLGDLIVHEVEQHNKFYEQNSGSAEDKKGLTGREMIQESPKKRKKIDLNENENVPADQVPITIQKNNIDLTKKTKFMINGHWQSDFGEFQCSCGRRWENKADRTACLKFHRFSSCIFKKMI